MIMSEYYKTLLQVAATSYLAKLRVLGLEETYDPYWSKNDNKFIRFCFPVGMAFPVRPISELQVKIAHYASLQQQFVTFLNTSSRCFHLKRQLYPHYSSTLTGYIYGRGINVINKLLIKQFLNSQKKPHLVIYAKNFPLYGIHASYNFMEI